MSRGASSPSTRLIKCRPLLNLGRKWLIGDGTSIKIWRDWCVRDSLLLSQALSDANGDILNLTIANYLKW